MGQVTVSHDELQDMLEEAAEKGARSALESLGLSAEDRPKIQRLMDFAETVQNIGKDARSAFVKGIIFFLLGCVGFGLLVYANIKLPFTK